MDIQYILLLRLLEIDMCHSHICIPKCILLVQTNWHQLFCSATIWYLVYSTLGEFKTIHKGQIIISTAISNIYGIQILCRRVDIEQVLMKISHIDQIGKKPNITIKFLDQICSLSQVIHVWYITVFDLLPDREHSSLVLKLAPTTGLVKNAEDVKNWLKQ